MLALVVGLSLSAQPRRAFAGGSPQAELKRVTLYGPNKYQHDTSRALYSFKTGEFGGAWDLNYGSLYVGEDLDWFEVSAATGVRSAFRDLGVLDWTDSFSVPVVEPFPKLKEGEQRTVTLDASGADGEDGAPGAPGKPGQPGADWDGVVRQKPQPAPTPAPAQPRRPKRDGVPKVDPIFAKAVAGHMYVIHVVDKDEDFYALFRVESLVRGDNCTITWKRVPTPQPESASKL
jgi:hypothetical protein